MRDKADTRPSDSKDSQLRALLSRLDSIEQDLCYAQGVVEDVRLQLQRVLRTGPVGRQPK